MAPTAVPIPSPTPEPPPVIPPGDTHFGVNESFLASHFSHQLGARWTRWVVDWSEIQRNGEGDFNTDDDQNTYYIDTEALRQEIRHGYQVMGVIRSTPEWAQTNPAFGVRSVPRGLDRPVDDPENAWAEFMRWMASRYAGRIDTWAIWNEVEIPPTGPNARYNTWAGSLEQYYRLLKVAWLAVRSVNPNGRIILAPYSYHRDKEWLIRFLSVASRDPEAAAHGYFFDIVGLNLYRNPHDLYDRKKGGTPWALEAADRTGVDEQLARFGLQKPVWVTEVNSMPYDDRNVEGWDPAARNDGFRITLDEQASFLIQAYALGIAAGYETIFWQAMRDDPPPVPDELWGLVRFHPDWVNADPASIRPAYTAYQVATRYLSNADRVEFVTVDRADPQVYRRNAPRYQWWIHQVAFQRGQSRTTVLWNGAGFPTRVALPKLGASAKVVDKYGNESPIEPAGNRWVVTLAAATRHFNLFGGDPPGYYYVGGAPILIVEEGVPADAPVTRVTVV
ncbi:MAG TPA: hypothetical protein VGW38_11255 [Chloroflexota bacterium]|nr:hypothetical protein [Chloroflexota bacterium]